MPLVLRGMIWLYGMAFIECVCIFTIEAGYGKWGVDFCGIRTVNGGKWAIYINIILCYNLKILN